MVLYGRLSHVQKISSPKLFSRWQLVTDSAYATSARLGMSRQTIAGMNALACTTAEDTLCIYVLMLVISLELAIEVQ